MLAVEHVGSTSVPLLVAKPIIDLDVVIDQNDLKEVIYLLEYHGYIYEGDLGLKDREAFRYEGKEHLRTHHLYVCPQDSKELKRHLAFRNYLRKHPNTVKEYGKIKKEAAKLYPNEIEKYIWSITDNSTKESYDYNTSNKLEKKEDFKDGNTYKIEVYSVDKLGYRSDSTIITLELKEPSSTTGETRIALTNEDLEKVKKYLENNEELTSQENELYDKL